MKKITTIVEVTLPTPEGQEPKTVGVPVHFTDDISTQRAVKVVGPMRVVVWNGAAYFVPADIDPLMGLTPKVELWTTSTRYSRTGVYHAQSTQHVCPVHSQGSRDLIKVLHMFELVSSVEVKAHTKFSLDIHTIEQAKIRVLEAEDALRSALPHLSKENVEAMIASHFKTVRETALADDVLAPTIAPDVMG